MDLIKQFREYSRLLNCHFGNINNSDCCCGEINKSQCFMIVEIGRKPDISVKELAEIMRVDKSGISRFVEDLVQKEYVERKPSATDRRFVTLNLLPKGQERFEKIEHDMYDRFKSILEQIPEDKRAQVVESLKIYNEACRIVEEKSMNKVEQSLNYFKNGFNCSQALLATFATDFGLSEEMALKVATQFGGGARMGEMCGAVSGALMVLGLKYGHYHYDASEEKANAYKLAQDFMNRFIEKNGTVVCRELLGYDLTKPEDMLKIKELDLFHITCPKMIQCATEIVEEML